MEFSIACYMQCSKKRQVKRSFKKQQNLVSATHIFAPKINFLVVLENNFLGMNIPIFWNFLQYTLEQKLSFYPMHAATFCNAGKHSQFCQNNCKSGSKIQKRCGMW